MSNEAEKLAHRAYILLLNVRYLNYVIRAVADARGEVYMQATYVDADIYTGEEGVQSSRRWLLSPAMTDSEIVSTAFKLCLTSAEHRCREAFTYKDARIFGPHFDVEDLVQLCQDGREDAGGSKA